MSLRRTEEQLRKLRSVFLMPSIQKIISRKSSITNAFVNSLIPVVMPTAEEIEEALAILGMTHSDVQCAYCGDPNSEWDHLRPLVIKRRPTGYISEIGNLVPSCGKCNQSKGNKPWLTWITSEAPCAPRRRGVPDLDARIERLKHYEQWRPSKAIEFPRIVGEDAYRHYWDQLDAVTAKFHEAQVIADRLREKIALAHGGRDSRNAVEIDAETSDGRDIV